MCQNKFPYFYDGKQYLVNPDDVLKAVCEMLGVSETKAKRRLVNQEKPKDILDKPSAEDIG